MKIQFNIAEIFEIAQQIERNGAAFYAKAASIQKNQDRKLLFLDLQDMEEKHERIFAYLKEQIVGRPTDQDVFDPDSNAAHYLHSFADGYIFDYRSDPSQYITGEKTLEDILKFAIGLEKDSIVFYYGIQELVPRELGKESINAIIKEEIKHITFLSDKIKTLSNE
jgi:rubrerythrin